MLSLAVATESWPLKAPFRITGYTFTECDVIVVRLRRGSFVGQGEAAGVYYHGESVDRLVAQIESVRGEIERGIDRLALRELLPPGGARNAIDAALWDLEAKERGVPCWQIAGLPPPKPLVTTLTVSAASPEEMARVAKSFAPCPRLKVKLTGEDDAARVRAIREARPEAWIAVDANQGYTRVLLERTLPAFVECGVRLIEQPVAVGDEEQLERLNSPIPIAADESVQGLADIAKAENRFDVVNIKLDKCGGLTEALLMVGEVRRRGMLPMVGCMGGTSLGIAPGFLAAQQCDFVDLDAAQFLRRDRDPPTIYKDGVIIPPVAGWGLPDHSSARIAASG